MKKLVPSAVAPGTTTLPDRVHDGVPIGDRNPIDGRGADDREDPLLEVGAIAPLRVRGRPVAPKIRDDQLSGFANGRSRVRRAQRAGVTAGLAPAGSTRRGRDPPAIEDDRGGTRPKVHTARKPHDIVRPT